MKRYPILGMVTLIAVLMLAACAPTPAEEPAAPAGDMTEDEMPTITMALLPVLDVLPFFIAEEAGYFEEEGIHAVGLPVNSALEADQLVQAGEADAVMNFIGTVALFNRQADTMRVVAIARSAEDGPMFRILAGPGSDLSAPADLAGVPVALGENTLVDYIHYRLLGEAGLTDDEIVLQGVPSVPERFQLMMSGQVEAAVLPDPLAQAGIENGATLVVEDADYPQYSVSTLNFLTSTLDENPEAVRAFLRAWFRAVDDLNANPDAYRALFLAKTNVPETVQDTYVIPPFTGPAVPTEEQVADMMDWLVFKGLIDAPMAYETIVTDAYLP